MRIIKVAARELLFALTNRMPETTHYLDTSTGEVMPAFSFNRDRVLALVRAEPERYVRIPPQSAGMGYEMMKRFAATVTKQDLRARLEAALAGKNVFREFRAVLKTVPAEYRRWRRFRIETMSEPLRARLKAKDVELVILPETETDREPFPGP